MKTACAVQCSQCPFRKNALPGWLGDYTPTSIFEQLWRSMPFFCHPKINYSDPNWAAKADRHGKLCLGAIAYSKKMVSPLRPDAYPQTDAEVIAARKANQDRADIDCMEVREFIDWHSNPDSMNKFIKSNAQRKQKSA